MFQDFRSHDKWPLELVMEMGCHILMAVREICIKKADTILEIQEIQQDRNGKWTSNCSLEGSAHRLGRKSAFKQIFFSEGTPPKCGILTRSRYKFLAGMIWRGADISPGGFVGSAGALLPGFEAVPD